MTPARTETSPFGPALPGPEPRRPTRDYTVVGLAGLLIVLAAASLFIGVQDLSPRDLFSLSDEQALVLFVSRLPRLISLVIAGASLSICGLIMQQLSRNKFVSPTTAGTLDSARLGILVAMLLFAGATPLQKLLVAFAFALAGTFVFMQILQRLKFRDAIFIPLVGMMFGGIVGSVTTFFAYRYDLLQSMSAWLLGSFALVMKGRYELLYISLPPVVLAYVFAQRFTIASLGEDFAHNLGLNYRQVVNIGLALVALVSAAVMLTVGTIPFLGLVVPNIVSLYRGDNLRHILPHTALLGATFLLACDIISRLIIFPYEMPISLTVGAIGSALFLYLLLRRGAHA